MKEYQLQRTDISYATVWAVDADEARRLADRHPEFWDICIGEVVCVDEATGEALLKERDALPNKGLRRSPVTLADGRVVYTTQGEEP